MITIRKIIRVLLTLVMAVMLVGISPLSTSILASSGYGTITGNVYQRISGSELYPATIIVENYNTGEIVGEFPNYPNGAFQVVVPDGTYRLGAHAPGYVTAWYPDNCRKVQSTPILVDLEGLVPDINFSLQQGGSISGTIYNQWSGTEQNQIVIAWTADTQEFVAWTFSNDNENHGQYLLEGLPYGSYKLSAGGPLPEGVEDPGDHNSNLIRGWWSQDGTVTSVNAAEIITIGNSTPIQNTNFQLQEGGQLEGRVNNENWNGLDDAVITLENYDTGEVLATTISYNRDGVTPGYFRFSGLSSDIDYCVWATATNRVIR
ncbi:MAG: hypothetical protein PHQ86_02510 [Dehalococcoidales bacterium]|nr:hypothetical protein [Dehalococcoidales bacterium]